MSSVRRQYLTGEETRKGTTMASTTGDQKELLDAWRLWHQLQALSDSIWKRYEPDFIELCIAEEDRRQQITGDDPLPF
jgi:hypothetical protein